MIKIIYFDDESATDILNIKNGGNLIQTSVDEESKKNEKEVKGKANIGVGIKNNYYLTDLENMNLVLYGVKVGKMNLESIDFLKSMDNWTNTPEMGMEDIAKAMENINEELEDEELANVYDIILAGVE